MGWFIVDVESDGPIPHKYSMVCFGSVYFDEQLKSTFYGQTKPISEIWIPEALAVSGFDRHTHDGFDEPKYVMEKFRDWIAATNLSGRPILVSDNLAYDWQWINYYFHYFLGANPFGFSGRRIGDMFAGIKSDASASWKHLRKTRHTHNPVDDAIGNAEALLAFKQMGMKLP